MIKYFILLFLSLLGFNIAFSQKATLNGKVTDFKKEGLPGVSILADSSTVGTVSDANGSYSFQLDQGKHIIRFKMIGMKEKKISTELKVDETKTLNATLEESASELGVVVVSAGRFEQKIEEVTVSMNVIKQSLIENTNTVEMDDILDQVPSVNVIDGQANIRGGSGWSYGAGSRVQIVVDDLPLLTADAGDVKWNFLPVESIEQVEVIKGASSVLYGSSALDGVISMRTAYPKDTAVTKVNFFTGMYDPNPKITLNDTTYKLNWSGRQLLTTSGLSFLHSEKIKNFDMVLGGNGFINDGYRQGEYEQRGRLNANLRYRFKNIEGLSCGVNANAMYCEENVFFIWQNDTTGGFQPKGGTDTATTTLSETITRNAYVDPFVTYVDNNGNSIKLRTRYFGSYNVNNTAQGSKSQLKYGEFQYQKHFDEKLTVSTGIVRSFDKVEAQLYGNHHGDNLAFYAQGDVKLNKFTFSLGGRVERSRIDSLTDKFIPVFRAGVNYHLFEATYLRSSYGQGYRYPSIAEKFITTQVGGLNILSNSSLQSEKGFTSEVGVMQGIKLGGWKGYLDVSGFYTQYYNMIEFTFSQWDTPTGGVFGFKGLNMGDTRIKGIDVSLTGEGKIGPLQVSVLAGYTFIDPVALRYDSSYINAANAWYPNDPKAYLGSDSSNFLKYRYSHLAKADVQIGYKKFSMGWSVRYNSFMRNIDKLFVAPVFGDLITPGVSHYRNARQTGDIVHDARVSYQLTQSTKISFIVKNVFDYIYMQRPTDMQPPRSFTFQAAVAF